MLEAVLYGVAATVGVVFDIGSALHALLHKRDPRSQLGWVVLCLLLPVIGGLAYWSFGVNRIRTRARRWQAGGRFALARAVRAGERRVARLSTELPEQAETMLRLLEISARVTERPLLGGNLVEPLFDGEEAYPAMLGAIDAAAKSVCLSTYLFDTDAAGRDFIAALERARTRGVEVRVLVDAIGERYARPRASRLLAEAGVAVRRFLPLAIGLRGLRANLRNHRKLLVVDSEVGFTGGMNLGQRHLVHAVGNRRPTADLHFRVRGPVVAALEETFMEDWVFAGGDDRWEPAPPPRPVGRALCRPIKDGPNEDFERLQWILIGAITCARHSVRIMTPYFIPNRELVTAINSAALHGATVELILPSRSNLPFVDWACRALLAELLHYGTRAYLQPPPFNHSKLLVVDDVYVNLGSANLDPRSLRLNFEFNLEVYDVELAARLARHFDAIRERSAPLTEAILDARSLAIQLRDASAKLFAPYL